MTDRSIAGALRRLTAAEGYLELDLPDYALDELDGIGDPGPYSGVADWLRGEAHKTKQEFNAAIESLQRAVRDIPAPHNRAAMESLTICFRSTGQDDLADIVEQISTVDEEAAAPTPLFHARITIVGDAGERITESEADPVDPFPGPESN
ncbi:MAG: hypothetical protein ACE5KM_07975 [Planctomycetaceae bacterium]